MTPTHKWIIVPADSLEIFQWAYHMLTGEHYTGEINPYGNKYRAGTSRLQDGFVARLLRAPIDLEVWTEPKDREWYSVDKHADLPDAAPWDGQRIHVENPSMMGMIKSGVYEAADGKWTRIDNLPSVGNS